MTDTPRVPPEPNWADYIDALRGFEPPTRRLALRQRALEAPSGMTPASEDDAAAQWWHPPGTGQPRK